MPVERESFLRELAGQRQWWSRRSPVNAGIVERLEADLSSGSPIWFRRLQEAYEDRSFANDYEASALLIVSLHHRRLSGGGNVLVDPAGWLNGAPPEFWARLRHAKLQANDPERSVGWLLVGCAALMPQGLPFHLVDMGTSAGLTLVGDYLPRDWSLKRPDGSACGEPPRWRDSPYPVLSRIGLDDEPRLLSDPRDRLWLKACIGPDEDKRHAPFDAAAELFLRLEKSPGGPRLERCAYAAMPEFIRSRFKPHAEEGLLVYNSQATDFLADREYRSLEKGLARVLKPWGDRGFWAELELPRDRTSKLHQLRVHRWTEGGFESRVLAALTERPGEIVIEEGWGFVRPLEPRRAPRVTIEEPPKRMEPGIYKFENPWIR